MDAAVPTEDAAKALSLSPSLAQALPRSLTGSGHGWLTRYRQYPVFSPAWARGRLRSWGLLILLVLGLLAISVLGYAGLEAFPALGIADLAVSLLLPLALGPWAGAWVRTRAWPPSREWPALLAVVLGVAAAMLAYSSLLSEPLKEAIAAATGEVDAAGQRKKVQMSVGVMLSDGKRASDASATRAAASGVAASAAAGASSAVARDLRKPVPQAIQAANLLAGAALYLWLSGGVALLGYRREAAGLQQLQREAELMRAQSLRREAETRLSVLAAQVEPHFLFNTLAGVRSAITTDPGRASEMIDHLVDYLRASIPRLRSEGSSNATLGAQLEMVRAYLALMTARMPRLRTEVQAPAELSEARFPPLMLISLAENAVKHGVEPKIGPACIEVTAQIRDDGRLAVCVSDDGVGFGVSTAGSGLGLANIRERLAALFGDRAELALTARPHGGVTACIVLPHEQFAAPSVALTDAEPKSA